MPIKIENEAELREAQAALFNINSQSGWLLINFTGPNTVRFVAGGEGEGIQDLDSQFEDNQIQYALIRVGGIAEKGTLKTTLRDIFITWIGPGVGIIEKGKKAEYLGDIQALLQPYHADITVLNRKHYSRDTIIDRSHPLSGSHVID